MMLEQDEIYHIYNRGNNRQQVFFYESHYLHFIKSMRKNICPYCEMLAWCLMPNHFHFLICANKKSIPLIMDGSFERQQFSQGIKQLLSSYTKGINEEMNFTGSRFQQKTKSKNVSVRSYAETAFHYIHQNPLKANLVEKIEDWPFSSFNEYFANKKPAICNKRLALEL
ncbi:MAG TPA: transposase, partial [Puia sp.]|nr:transposase [Puia sp.]